MVRLMREPVDAACFAMVAIAQAAVRAALVVMPIGAVRRTGARLRFCGWLIAARWNEDRLLIAIEATGRRLGAYSTCLVRALVAEMLLTGIDLPMRLMIGVRRAAASRLESHAWFERHGRVSVGGAGALGKRPPGSAELSVRADALLCARLPGRRAAARDGGLRRRLRDRIPGRLRLRQIDSAGLVRRRRFSGAHRRFARRRPVR